jgi:hypothetical protein
METIEKYSVTPISFGDFEEGQLNLPFPLQDIRVDSIEGLLSAEHFGGWKHWISDDSIDRLSRAKVALVHQFASGYVAGKGEEDSKDLLHKAFVCLRVVKPTRTPFSLVQYRKVKDGSIDVFSAFWPLGAPMNLPESEVLNQIGMNDLQQLRKLWPSFRRLRDSGPAHLRRATRYYETGYAEQRDFDLQFITWMMGIEALYAEEGEPCTYEVIKERILESVGPDADIYAESVGRALYAPNALFVSDVVDKMFELRNRFIHGVWAPKSWLDKPMRNAISGGSLTLPDVLREAASFILRTGIKKKLLGAINSV